MRFIYPFILTEVSCFNSRFQLTRRAVLSCANLVQRSAVFIQSTLMVQVPLMCTVTKQQPEGGGQCSKRDWTALLISTAAGGTTNLDSET